MAMNVSQFQPSDNFNMAEFNDKITQINSGVNSEVSALNTRINEGAKIETGTYVGTGTYTSSNPNSLTFGFVPKLVFLSRNITANTQNGLNEGSYSSRLINPSNYAIASKGSFNSSLSPSETANCPLIVSWNNTSVSWYCPYNANYQLNTLGITYHYIAIG